MQPSRSWRTLLFTDMGILILLALAVVLGHVVTNGQYGFHRDELGMLDDARYLDWGYVSYPPLTPWIARVALELFGTALIGVRLFAALAQGIAVLLAGLMARELGGGRFAQVVAAASVAIAPVSLTGGIMLHYLTFDYLWWVVTAYMAVRLLKTRDPRWWLGIGAGIGLGMLTKYTMAFFAAGIVAAVLLTPARRALLTRWPWAGAALALLICLPNLLWQAQHGFVTLEFVNTIHARDVAWGRGGGFLAGQFYDCTNPFTVPLWIAGLGFYFFSAQGKPFRALGWMYLVPFALLLWQQGRFYYLAPAYPMLLAAGAALLERWLGMLSLVPARLVRGITWAALVLGGALAATLTLPLAPVGSPVWDITYRSNENFREMIGWPELVHTIAGIYAGMPAAEQAHTAILAGNYGEVGALNLYGPAYGLPEAISGVNTSWYRGYGDAAAQAAIVVGIPRSDLASLFRTCSIAGQNTNRYGVQNEESMHQGSIYLCREPRTSWADLWPRLRTLQ